MLASLTVQQGSKASKARYLLYNDEGFFVLGAALFGFGVNGAFAGFATAASCIWILSTKWLDPMSHGEQIPTGVIKFAFGMVMLLLVFNLSFKIDAFFIRNKLQAILSDPTTADQLLGEYGIAVSLSRLPNKQRCANACHFSNAECHDVFKRCREEPLLR